MLDSDLTVYVGAGVFMSLVFVVAMAVVAASPRLELTPTVIGGFVVGFGISMAVYYLAYGVYQFIEYDERSSGPDRK